MKLASTLKTFEKRIHLRSPYSGHLFFATKDRCFEGELENFCRDGLCIKISEPLPLDEIITIALPFLDGKLKGQIVWCSRGRFGVELFKKRSDPELRVIK